MTTESTVGDALKISELLKALPSEINEEAAPRDPLADLIVRLSTRAVPVSSLARMWSLGSMQAKIAMAYLAYAVRGKFMDETERQKLLNETNLTAALKLLGTMGYLRGAIMKVGQMLASLPKVLPKEFAEVLGCLHFEAPPMHYAMIREVFIDELGQEPEEVFASFERQAFAAASLGQVHRARLKTGEQVAVKIQYPNMQRMIASDMHNLRTLVAPMRFHKDWAYLMDHIADAEEMLRQEADYGREAAFMERARQVFSDEARIVAPGCYRNFSSSRVLTMDYLEGIHLQEFMRQNPPPERRNHFGELISMAMIRLSYHARSYYADPHPGNFLLMADGRLGFLDFGCYRELSEEEWQMRNDGEKAVIFTHDQKLLDKVIAYGCLHDSTAEMKKEWVDLVQRTVAWQGEPALRDEPFDFSDEEWFQRGVDIMVETGKQRQSRYAPAYNWINRSIIGHRTLMYRLQCRFNFRRVYMENNPNVSAFAR